MEVLFHRTWISPKVRARFSAICFQHALVAAVHESGPGRADRCCLCPFIGLKRSWTHINQVTCAKGCKIGQQLLRQIEVACIGSGHGDFALEMTRMTQPGREAALAETVLGSGTSQ